MTRWPPSLSSVHPLHRAPAAAAALALISFVGATASADLLSDVKAGKIIASSVGDSGVRASRAIGLVNAPAAVVEQIVGTFEEYKAFVPRCVGSRRVKEGAYVVESDLPWPVNRTWVYVRAERKSQGTTRFLRWRMLNGTLRAFEGMAWIQPLGNDKSVLTYQMLAVPHTVAPDALISYGLREAGKEMIEAIRERAALVLARTPAKGVKVAAH